jgi:MtN3 and saliva related transmembrane protein
MLKYLGYFAGTLTVVSFIPQVYKTWKTKETKDLSLGAFVLLISACSLWAIYGIIIEDLSVILTNVGMVLLVGAIGVAKLRFG